jgi:undecaprenyl phosphate-alpha-L-ara4N flippase subunit ArnE
MDPNSTAPPAPRDSTELAEVRRAAAGYPPPLAWVLHPYVQILIGALLNVAGEVLLKRGAITHASVGLFGIAALASVWTWIGVACYVVALLNWLWVLRTVPVSIAFSLMNAVYVLVPLAANIFLHEPIHPRRWLGIALVLGGALIIARPLAAAEEKL